VTRFRMPCSGDNDAAWSWWGLGGRYVKLYFTVVFDDL